MKKTKGRRKASVILLFLVFLVLLCGCGSHKGEEVKNRGQEEVETIEKEEIENKEKEVGNRREEEKKEEEVKNIIEEAENKEEAKNVEEEETLKELIRTYITERMLSWGDSGEVVVSEIAETPDQKRKKQVVMKVLFGDGTGTWCWLDIDNLQKKEKGEKYYGDISGCSDMNSALTVRQNQEKEILYHGYWGIEKEEWFHFSFYSQERQEEWIDQIGEICKKIWEEENFLYSNSKAYECKEYTFQAWAVKGSPLEVAALIENNIYLFKYSLTQEQIVYVGYIGGQDELWELFTEEDALYLGEGSFAIEEGAEPEYVTGPEAEKIREIWQWSVEEHLKKYGKGDYIWVETGQYQDIYPRLWAKAYYEDGYFWVYSYGTRLGELTPCQVADDYLWEMITWIKE